MAKVTYIATYSGKLTDGNQYTSCKMQVEEPVNTSYYDQYEDKGKYVVEYKLSAQTVKAICELYKLDTITKLFGHDVTIASGRNAQNQRVAYMVTVNQ